VGAADDVASHRRDVNAWNYSGKGPAFLASLRAVGLRRQADSETGLRDALRSGRLCGTLPSRSSAIFAHEDPLWVSADDDAANHLGLHDPAMKGGLHLVQR
jgi:hypothetical protein